MGIKLKFLANRNVGHLQVNVAHSFLYRFAVEHIFMPVECCRLLKLSHPFSKWTRPSPRTNQNAPRCSNRLAPFKNGLTKQLRLLIIVNDMRGKIQTYRTGINTCSTDIRFLKEWVTLVCNE